VSSNGTPLGDLRLAASDLGLIAVEWAAHSSILIPISSVSSGPSSRFQKNAPYARELYEYLNRTRSAFTIPIDWSLFRPFQREALQAVFRIPYGETCTYHDIALEIGRPNASRAVGRANATNPMPIVIPCHRVIGRDGKLHGYGGGEGLRTKEWLLRLEGAVMA
jgi:methylated-DNA-[protein]-cysteine S-methyltransferase